MKKEEKGVLVPSVVVTKEEKASAAKTEEELKVSDPKPEKALGVLTHRDNGASPDESKIN